MNKPETSRLDELRALCESAVPMWLGAPVNVHLNPKEVIALLDEIRRLAAENAALNQEVGDKCDSINAWRAKAMALEEENAAQAERIKRLEGVLRAMLAWSEEFAGRNTDEADAKAELLACQNARAELEPRDE